MCKNTSVHTQGGVRLHRNVYTRPVQGCLWRRRDPNFPQPPYLPPAFTISTYSCYYYYLSHNLKKKILCVSKGLLHLPPEPWCMRSLYSSGEREPGLHNALRPLLGRGTQSSQEVATWSKAKRPRSECGAASGYRAGAQANPAYHSSTQGPSRQDQGSLAPQDTQSKGQAPGALQASASGTGGQDLQGPPKTGSSSGAQEGQSFVASLGTPPPRTTFCPWEMKSPSGALPQT